jgi:hypothetical protein
LAITREVSAMNLKTFWLTLWLALAVAPINADERAKTAQGGDLAIKVSVFNDAQISDGKVATAESVAARLFAHAGIRIDWLNCGHATETGEERASCSKAAFPEHFAVRLRQRSLNLNESTLGLSFLGDDGIGCHANVFYAGVEPIQQEAGLSAEAILGLVIAHELGHLLLGTNSHADRGIMRANWKTQELSLAGKGRLGFTENQAQKMRVRLESASLPVGPLGPSRSR